MTATLEDLTKKPETTAEEMCGRPGAGPGAERPGRLFRSTVVRAIAGRLDADADALQRDAVADAAAGTKNQAMRELPRLAITHRLPNSLETIA